jgi:hypothetical protein
MSSAFALIIVVTISADVPSGVHLTAGQELVYRGRYSDDSGERRAADIEARVFVLESGPAGAEVAFLTVLRPPGGGGDAASAARLEVGTVDERGHVILARGGTPRLSLDGPPTLEPAAFVELPARPAAVWDVADGVRPPREWRVLGEDFGTGTRCLKLIGEQQSAAWARPVDATPAWRRTETVWLAPATGLVQRLERTIEMRGPDGSSRGASRMELERVETSALQGTAELRSEIQFAVELDRRLTALVSQPDQKRQPEFFAALVERIDGQVAGQPRTPYRAAVLGVRRRAEAAARGEVPPPAEGLEPPPLPPVVGRPADDFIAADLNGGEPVRLARWLGRPVVLAFVRPNGTSAGTALRLAADLQSRYGDRVHVAVLVDSDEDRARPAWAAFGVPLLAGRDVATRYGAGGIDRLIMIDAEGVVRHIGIVGPGVIDAVQHLAGRSR